MNIVIPMAGLGSRFSKAGYTLPKPFIDVGGKPMIERVLDNLEYPGARFILIVREEHVREHGSFIEQLRRNYNCEVLTVNQVTEGAACTILLSTWLINNDTPLLLANSDQIVDIKMADYIQDSDKRKMDGSILTFFAEDTKWSYVKINEKGLMTNLREKEVISKYATVGIYYFRRGHDFVNSAVEMIANNDRVKNEFYTAPVYNYSVKHGLKIGIYNIEPFQMHGLGTPEDLTNYLYL